MSAKEKALESMRARCKAIYQQIGRDAMLRQNDPVETLFRFALGLTDDNSYVIGFNAGWEEREATWQAAGYRILAPGEVDAETVERCATVLDKGVYASKHDVELAWELAGLIRSLGRRA